MTYENIIELLKSDKIYNEFKKNEEKIFELIPELKICKGFNQNSVWHIYDVYEHILHVVFAVDNNKCLRIAALFHDIGKPLVYTEDKMGIGHFYNHWNKSIEIFKKYHDKFNLNNEEIKLINNLIFYHDVNVTKMNMDEKIKMINSIGSYNINLLFNLKKSDLLAQSPEFHYLLQSIIEQEKDINSIIEERNIEIEELINSIIYSNKIEYRNLVIFINNIINSKTTDENIISKIYDRILSLVFINDIDIKSLFYTLYNYTKTFNKQLSDDYEIIFLDYFKEDNEFNNNLSKKLKKQ